MKRILTRVNVGGLTEYAQRPQSVMEIQSMKIAATRFAALSPRLRPVMEKNRINP